MKITLLLVGKTLKGWIKDGLGVYAGRLEHYSAFNIVEIPELKNASSLTREQIKKKEGDMILKSLKAEDNVILLDERGVEHGSLEWAAYLQTEMSKGRNIVFAIGGAYGFSEDVYARANGKISLSRMTFSHQMVRVIFAEQLYRAFTIINGEPYHHE